MNNIISDLLEKAVVDKISNNLGNNSAQTKSAMSDLLPELLGGLTKNSKKREGLDLLTNALKKDHDGSVLNNLDNFLKNPSQGKGNKILQHVLGDKTEFIRDMISKKTGLGKENTAKLMETLSPLVMGALGKEAKKGENVSEVLKNSLQDFDYKKLAISFLDKDGDGEIKDDLITMGKNYLKKFLS